VAAAGFAATTPLTLTYLVLAAQPCAIILLVPAACPFCAPFSPAGFRIRPELLVTRADGPG
jgi:hypothetical protein